MEEFETVGKKFIHIQLVAIIIFLEIVTPNQILTRPFLFNMVLGSILCAPWLIPGVNCYLPPIKKYLVALSTKAWTNGKKSSSFFLLPMGFELKPHGSQSTSLNQTLFFRLITVSISVHQYMGCTENHIYIVNSKGTVLSL